MHTQAHRTQALQPHLWEGWAAAAPQAGNSGEPELSLARQGESARTDCPSGCPLQGEATGAADGHTDVLTQVCKAASGWHFSASFLR